MQDSSTAGLLRTKVVVVASVIAENGPRVQANNLTCMMSSHSVGPCHLMFLSNSYCVKSVSALLIVRVKEH